MSNDCLINNLFLDDNMSELREISTGRVIFSKKISENGDTQVFYGTYYGKVCAIKKVKTDEFVGVKSKILREISFLKKVKHENIVKLYDVCYDDENIYIILEQGACNLINLKKIGLADKIVEQDILAGLVHMETCGYLHGDLNFKNVLLFNSNKKAYVHKLIDFGLTTRLYRKYAVKTPAPCVEPLEMKNGLDFDPEKIDAWAFGCLSYYINNPEPNCIITKENAVQIFEKMVDNNSTLMFILNPDINARYGVCKYYNKIKKSFKKVTKVQQNSNIEIFKHDKKKYMDDKTRHILLFTMMNLNILNNIPVENMFMTIKLLNLLKLKSSDENIECGIILYYLTTKLIAANEVSSLHAMNLINNIVSSPNKIGSLKEFNKKVINILFQLEWNIDTDTQISHILSTKDKFKEHYINYCLAIICFSDFDVFLTNHLNKAILVIVGQTKADKNDYLLDNTCKKILASVDTIKKESNRLFNLIKMYLK